MKEPAVQETGDTLRLHEAAEEVASSAPRGLRAMGYADGAQSLRPKDPPGGGTPSSALAGSSTHGVRAMSVGASPASVAKKPPTAKSPIGERMAWWNTHAPKADYRRVRFRGVLLNKRTVELFTRAEAIMVSHFKHRKFQFVISQGSYHEGYGPSGGTHDGGGSIDVQTRGYPKDLVDDMVRALRIAGFAAWSRGRGQDPFPPHIHGIAIGDKEASAGAKSQVGDYADGENGLSNHAPDADKDLKAKAPKWANKYL